jgi:hypothetical protein
MTNRGGKAGRFSGRRQEPRGTEKKKEFHEKKRKKFTESGTEHQPPCFPITPQKPLTHTSNVAHGPYLTIRPVTLSGTHHH